MIKAEETVDSLNLQDDHPTIMFGPQVENTDDDEVPPFYISLKVHDLIHTMLCWILVLLII